MAALIVIPLVRRGFAQLAVIGKLDRTSVDRLAQHGINQLLEPDVAGLVLDLDEVSFIDGAGLSVLIRLRNVARHVGKQLVLVCGSPRMPWLVGVPTGPPAIP